MSTTGYESPWSTNGDTDRLPGISGGDAGFLIGNRPGFGRRGRPPAVLGPQTRAGKWQVARASSQYAARAYSTIIIFGSRRHLPVSLICGDQIPKRDRMIQRQNYVATANEHFARRMLIDHRRAADRLDYFEEFRIVVLAPPTMRRIPVSRGGLRAEKLLSVACTALLCSSLSTN